MTIIKQAGNFIALAVLLALTACNSTGVIPADVNLSLKDVSVIQVADVAEGAKFSHRLREEVRYEFSKAEQGTKEASIVLEVRELVYSDPNSKSFGKNKSTMISFGTLVDAATGESIGEFPLKVATLDEGVDTSSLSGRVHIQTDLIQRMARATLEKVYGKSRAKSIGEKFARHKREPYIVQVINPIQLSSLPQDILNGIPDSVIVEPPTQEASGDDIPKVIEAPQLPVK
jgi:hypothetical protein